MMNQTRKDLIVKAKAENVPYSGLNKRALIDRIQHYRDTVGTLYRERKSSLKALEKGLWRFKQAKVDRYNFVSSQSSSTSN